MSSRYAKRPSLSTEEVSLSDSTSTREEEKCIPFLRRLTDMLSENEDVISFKPGYRNSNGEVVLGKIVVHDRVKTEATVLPRYFNHSSFASLRRQLNYFSFTRIGKGRQMGAQYTNEGVIVLEDILNLKRRSVTGGPSPTASQDQPVKARASKGGAHPLKKRSHDSLNRDGNKRMRFSQTTPSVPTEISPNTSFVSSDEEHPSEEPRIALDLTVSSNNSPAKASYAYVSRPLTVLHDASLGYPGSDIANGDADIIAGCRALLNFAGFSHSEEAISSR